MAMLETVSHLSGSPTSEFAMSVLVDDEHTCWLDLSGELDLACAAELSAELDRLAEGGHRIVRVGVARLAFCDSAGLGALLRGRQALAATGGTLIVDGVDRCRPLRRLLDVTGLGARLGVASH